MFHLAAKNQANLEIACRFRVDQPAPIYLTSAWGSQYWTLYSPLRRELAQIHTDERLDLSRPGEHTVRVAMNRFSEGASPLAPTGYAFITESSKSFLIYGLESLAAASPNAAKWDTVKVERLSRHLGPAGLVAPFSLADLTSYKLRVSARVLGDHLVARPVLEDAQKREVPLYGMELQIRLGDRRLTLASESADDGSPTGDYAIAVQGVMPASVEVFGRVRLGTPSGVREATIDQTATVRPAAQAGSRQPPRLDLIGWGYPAYELSTKASHGPESMRRLVADARAAGVTKLVIHARTSTETLYPSRIAASVSVGEWDVLAAAVAEGRRQGVTIYAAYVLGIAQDTDLKAHPDWAMLDRHGKPTGWYCYTNREVRDFHAALLSEIVARYPVAGVSLDFCRPRWRLFLSALCGRLHREARPAAGRRDRSRSGLGRLATRPDHVLHA